MLRDYAFLADGERGCLLGPRGEWCALADQIVSSVSADCLHPSGRWQRAPEDPRVDVALLLPSVRGALSATDPRSVATLQAVLDDLVEDDFVYRYATTPGP